MAEVLVAGGAGYFGIQDREALARGCAE